MTVTVQNENTALKRKTNAGQSHGFCWRLSYQMETCTSKGAPTVVFFLLPFAHYIQHGTPYFACFFFAQKMDTSFFFRADLLSMFFFTWLFCHRRFTVSALNEYWLDHSDVQFRSWY